MMRTRKKWRTGEIRLVAHVTSKITTLSLHCIGGLQRVLSLRLRRIFSAKPSPESMLTYCWLNTKKMGFHAYKDYQDTNMSMKWRSFCSKLNVLMHLISFGYHYLLWLPSWLFHFMCRHIKGIGLILGLRPANERRRYKVSPSLIGWAQT